MTVSCTHQQVDLTCIDYTRRYGIKPLWRIMIRWSGRPQKGERQGLQKGGNRCK